MLDIARQLVHPVTGTLVLLVAAAAALLWHRRRLGLAFVVAAFAWTYLLATPVVADALLGRLEARFPPSPVDRIPAADAIVVLGGGGVTPEAEPRLGPDLGDAVDRVWFGARLYRAGKAPLVITTGARPFADTGPTAAQAQAAVLGELGVPADAIVTAGDSTSTYTDALEVDAILDERGLDRILLVTSALHMPRALKTFQAAGIATFPAPTDHEVTDADARGEYAWLPSAHAFWATSRAVHEYVGIAFYRLTRRF